MTNTIFHEQSDTADIVVGLDGSQESFEALRWALLESRISGQHIHVVFGSTHSPHSEETANGLRQDNNSKESNEAKLAKWITQARAGIPFDENNLSVSVSDTDGIKALLELGKSAEQIVVGRRSLGGFARLFSGSLSTKLAEISPVPVTVVRSIDEYDSSVEADIEDALSFDKPSTGVAPHIQLSEESSLHLPVVVGVNNSVASQRALHFAARIANSHRVPLHVISCWQLKDLGVIPGYENAVAPIAVGQAEALRRLESLVNDSELESSLDIHLHAFHIPVVKGLINASQYAGRLVVGSRGFSGLDAHFFGSVSRQMVNLAQCTVTVVH